MSHHGVFGGKPQRACLWLVRIRPKLMPILLRNDFPRGFREVTHVTDLTDVDWTELLPPLTVVDRVHSHRLDAPSVAAQHQKLEMRYDTS